jgi:hypothetical protein
VQGTDRNVCSTYNSHFGGTDISVGAGTDKNVCSTANSPFTINAHILGLDREDGDLLYPKRRVFRDLRDLSEFFFSEINALQTPSTASL